MGLDIHIFTDIDEEFFKDDAFETQIQKNRVSRTFCNFMCRENVINHSTELEQIGTITGTDIIPLLKMRDYPDEESIYLSLSVAETGEEKQKVMEEAKADKEKLNGKQKILKRKLHQNNYSSSI